MKQASWNFDCKLVILNDLDRETKLSLVPLSQCSFLVLLTIFLLTDVLKKWQRLLQILWHIFWIGMIMRITI